MKITQTDKKTPCSQTGRITIVKITILPKAIYRFKAILYKIQRVFFTELGEIILRYMEFRKMLIITLYAKQKKRHRCIEQTFGLWEKARVGCF